jgi:hypothetical protein
LDLEHSSRQRWVDEIGKINKKTQQPQVAQKQVADEDDWWRALLNQ